MSRTIILAGFGLAWTFLGACAPESEKRDLEFALHKTEQERDALARQVSSEQAKNTVLLRRVETEEYASSASRAQVHTLQEQIDKLTRANQELEEVLRARRAALEQPPERPAVSGSPLPPAVDQALLEFATHLPDRVTYDRGRAAVSFANDRLFDPGSATVQAEAQSMLRDLATILARTNADQFEVIVVGHTDSDPIRSDEVRARHATNWHLSVHRAIGVKDILVEAGLPATRVGVMGYGEYRPISDDRAQNRRVEVFISRKGTPQPFEPVPVERHKP